MYTIGPSNYGPTPVISNIEHTDVPGIQHVPFYFLIFFPPFFLLLGLFVFSPVFLSPSYFDGRNTDSSSYAKIAHVQPDSPPTLCVRDE